MRKPLELTVYLPDGSGDYEHPVYGFWVTEEDADHHMEAKRLTDAELAAEYWKAKERCMFVSAFSGFSIRPDSALAKQAEVLHRFATHPHYDEAPA